MCSNAWALDSYDYAESWLSRYLPTYLDELVFRFNRRHTPMAAFQTLLGIASGKKPITLAQLRS